MNWLSTTIQTVAQNEGNRAPVVTGLSIRPGSDQIAIVGDDHRIGIYDQTSHRFTHSLDEHRDWIRATRYSPDGTRLITAGNDRRILLWNTDDYDFPTRVAIHPEAVIEVAFSPNGQQLACVGFETSLRIYDTISTQKLLTLECACSDNHAVAYSRDSRWIAAGGRSGTIRVWNVTDGSLVSEFVAHRKRIRSIEFNEQGQVLSCAEDQTARVTDPRRPEEPVKIARQSAKLFDIKLIDEELFATGGADNLIHIWRLSDAELVGSLKGHTGTVSCLDANATHLVSGSYDTQVRVWTLQTDAARGHRHTKKNQGWNQQLK